LLAQARESAAAGINELMLIRFRHIVRRWRRAITLPMRTGRDAARRTGDIFARWRQELEPKGFRLAAQIVDFPMACRVMRRSF